MCPSKSTIATLVSDVTGLSDVKYQWVNNYSDVDNGNDYNLIEVGLGPYWL